MDRLKPDSINKIGYYTAKVFEYIAVSLTILLLLFFLILPTILIVSKAFIGPEGWTLEYFSLLFSNNLQMSFISNSLMIGLFTTISCTIISLPLAIFNARFEYRFKSLLSALLLVPLIMPPFVGAIGIQRFFARFGAINIFLLDHNFIQSPINWLADENMFWAVIFLETLHLYPIMYLNLTAAIANIDPSLDEAATICGSSLLQRYKNILWPLIRPGFLSGALIIFIWSFTDLGTPLLVGYHETIPVFIFNMVTDINENPIGFALVFIVILITTSIFIFSKFGFNEKKYQMMGRGHTNVSVKKASFLFKIIIYPTVISTISIALIPHITVIITSFSDGWFMTALPEKFTTKYYYQVFSHDLSLIGIKNSILFSCLATFLDVILGVLLAYIIVRKSLPFSQFLDALVMTPLALPGIILAFGYVVSYTGTFLDPLTNPIPLLIIAYSVRRLPFMVRSAVSGFQQINSSLEEASQVMGASKLYTLRKITIPLITANLIAGGLLCFSYAMLDVSDSLILAMKDQYYPLTKSIYSLYLEQGSGEFVASALGSISMIILSVCIIGSSVLLGKKMGELFKG
mgnify:CR=1 FL=1